MLHAPTATPTDVNTRPIEEAFYGSHDVTRADIAAFRAANINTIGDFVRIASDADLTDNGFDSATSLRLTTAFEQSAYAYLLPYMNLPAPEATTAVTTPAPATPVAEITTPSDGMYARAKRWWLTHIWN